MLCAIRRKPGGGTKCHRQDQLALVSLFVFFHRFSFAGAAFWPQQILSVPRRDDIDALKRAAFFLPELLPAINARLHIRYRGSWPLISAASAIW